MSLINDALRRAKQRHDQRSSPSLRGAPVPGVPAPRPSRLWPVAIISFSLAIIVSGVGVWLTLRHPSPAGTEQGGPTPPPVVIAAKPVVAVVPPAPVNVPAAEAAKESPAPASAPAPEPVVEPTNLPPATPPVPPPPQTVIPVVRLQGILWAPSRPAAILNGRTMFVGDSVSDITVVAISQRSATVVWGGKTNVLTLP